ncbi:carboxypeptidase S [Cantharellus anzutake]|uniref:carboxypeptidase S n=1 Tax=Cantharellus anzutake TaxID=1750568 RepID=UPI001902DDDA|nr:carboxypeptidase S [Cantharellus anzutake]KAF8341297.1 carboxypeptidase S [Cantharellus anzutake]
MGFPGDKSPSQASAYIRIWRLLQVSALLLVLTVLALWNWALAGHVSWIAKTRPAHSLEPICPQTPALFPRGNVASSLNSLIAHASFLNRSNEWLGGAIKIPTESYDDMGTIGTDPRWDVFQDLHQYMINAFPRLHKVLQRTTVNTYALVYHWQGSDSSLKPILLTAHQDVVPVDPTTVEEWVHPPYSGFFDGTYIWGRGSLDDKNGLIGLLSAIEVLLESGFVPRRTIGAGHLSVYLEKTYGKGAFSLLVDEGGSIGELGGAIVASPEVAEKGYMDVNIRVATPGGHSSIPPSHTSIGLLAIIIAELEAHPSAPRLTRASPFYSYIQCITNHAPLINPSFSELVRRSVHSDKALQDLEKVVLVENEITRGGFVRSVLSTTQAVDLIIGGVKVNALPEQASAVVNHRISTDSSVEELMTRLTSLILPLAHQYNLSFNAFGSQLGGPNLDSSSGSIMVSDAFNSSLEPSPISPTDSLPYELLHGTIRATYEANGLQESIGTSTANAAQPKFIVAPSLGTGNTDTIWYWNLTRNIFRYNYATIDGAYGGIHTTNEAVKATMFVDGIRFFAYLILNADEMVELWGS